MRMLTDHIVNPANDRLKIEVTDEPGSGGANHAYVISGFDGPDIPAGSGYVNINFQNGPINEAGVNGITHEALLAILVDRLKGFQAGAFAGKHNAEALHHLSVAQTWLDKRTKERMARGVEGTHKV